IIRESEAVLNVPHNRALTQRCSQYIFDHTRFKKVYSLAQIMGSLFLHENCMISDTRKKDPALLHPT
ncbi:hypothetical protein, partial [Lacticaseibacillus paracasei]|uniref:hypothetical protein n=1 Tax=Lacticaseibacillus paracasei TaxID=1597 RepID=UPI001CDB2B75